MKKLSIKGVMCIYKNKKYFINPDLKILYFNLPNFSLYRYEYGDNNKYLYQISSQDPENKLFQGFPVA